MLSAHWPQFTELRAGKVRLVSDIGMNVEGDGDGGWCRLGEENVGCGVRGETTSGTGGEKGKTTEKVVDTTRSQVE